MVAACDRESSQPVLQPGGLRARGGEYSLDYRHSRLEPPGRSTYGLVRLNRLLQCPLHALPGAGCVGHVYPVSRGDSCVVAVPNGRIPVRLLFLYGWPSCRPSCSLAGVPDPAVCMVGTFRLT